MTELSAPRLEMTGADVSDAYPPDPQPRSAVHVTWWFSTLAIVSIGLAVAGRLASSEALTLIGAYGTLLFGVGAAPFQLRTDISLLIRTAGSFVVGFGVLMIGGALMADVPGLWSPVLAAATVGTIAVCLHAVGLWRAWLGMRPAGRRVAFVPVSANEWRPLSVSVGRRPGTKRGSEVNRWSLASTVLGAALCLGRAATVRDPHPTWWGLLTVVGPLWYVGFGLVLAGFAVGYRSELSAAAAVIAIALATTLTPALIYGAPRSPTAEKQMWLTQHVIQYHHVTVTAGIYPAFSALFAGVAWLCSLTGIRGMSGRDSLWGLATYWPVVMALGRVAVLRLMMQSVASTTARRWTAVMLVLLTDSISDANYFSPQALGYVLGIGAIGFALRGQVQQQLGARWTVPLVAMAGLALAPTHEISPYMVAGALLLLFLCRQARWWGWLAVGLPAGGWAVVVHNQISGYFNFSTLFDITNFTPPKTYATPGLSRMPIIGYQSHALLLDLVILILLAAAAALPNIKRGWVWGYSLSAGTGLGVIAVNPYGNEGIFRAALFGIPWLAALAVRGPMPTVMLKNSVRRRVATASTLFAVCVALGALFLVASYSLDLINVLQHSEVASDLYLQNTHEPSLELDVESGSDSGNPFGAYANFLTIDWDDVANGPLYETLHPTASTLRRLTLRYQKFAVRNGVAKDPLYVSWSGSFIPILQGYGLGTSSQMHDWLTVLEHSDEWQRVFHDGGYYLFRLRSGPGSPETLLDDAIREINATGRAALVQPLRETAHEAVITVTNSHQ